MKQRFSGLCYGILRMFCPVMLCFFLTWWNAPALSENTDENIFSVKRIGQMICYRENVFSVNAPEDGEFSVTVYDEVCIYRIIRRQISKGTTEIKWDGCGYNGERLDTKYYSFDFRLDSVNGNTYTFFFRSPIVENAQHLQFVLPSSGTAFLNRPDEWFIEMKAVRNGTVRIEMYRENTPEDPVRIVEKTIHNGRVEHFTLDKLFGRKQPEPGDYSVRIYEVSREDEKTEFPLKIKSAAPEKIPVTVTGPVMPRRDAGDDEIWQAMMKPSVVVDIDPLKHQTVYAEPDRKSPGLGTLHGQTQGLEVIEIGGEWAKIGAWNHEEAEYIEGWVPTDRLKTVEPNPEYGLLIDKKSQTMSVFRKGERIETLLVSTGRMDPGKYDRETSAGCFLTGLHRVDFSTQGLKYDFVIQYDGGNLLHQIPYSSDGRRDFTQGKAYLGTKASHACIRIQDVPGDDYGINAYWIWTHVPYRTRIIILDDPEERAAEKARLSGSVPVKNADVVLSAGEKPEKGIVLTFAGSVIPAYSEYQDSFDQVFRQIGKDHFFEGLRDIFSKDDLTCVSLACVLKEDGLYEDPYRSVKWRGLPEYAEIFKGETIEMVSLGDDHLYDYRQEGYETTAGIMDRTVCWTGKNHALAIEINGCLFGFATCSQQDYLADTECIGREILSLKNQGCKYVIALCFWGNENDTFHGKLQEAMARKCVRDGADLVVGCHPASVQGIGQIDGTPVVYSLGWLNTDRSVRRKSFDSLAVQAVFHPEQEKKKPEIVLLPLLSSSLSPENRNDYRPVRAEGEDLQRILNHVQADSGLLIPGTATE